MGRILVTIVLACGVAHAQPSSGFISKDVVELEIDKCDNDRNITKDEHVKRRTEYYARGETLYLQGDYPGAVSELVLSYCEAPYYSILKDIGQAYERQLEYGKAIAYFSRYVLQVPIDAKKANDCAPDPQDEKNNVLKRIQVLQRLPAQIRVQATPEDVRIEVVQDNVVKAHGTSGTKLEVEGGSPYQLVVHKDGFHTKTVEIHPEVGKPYTYVEELLPVMGRLHVRVIPGDARLFVDKRQVGTGTYEAEVPGGRYTIQAEAQDRQTESRLVDVTPDKDSTVTFELKAQPEFGRQQLLIFGGVAGATSAALLAGAQSSRGLDVAAAGGGIAAGLFGVYYGTPRNLALGTSSLTVTASLIGGVAGGALGIGVQNDINSGYAPPLAGGGLLVGAAIGYYIGDRTHPTPGDSAVINSGALWGTVAGGLFTLSFDPGPQIGAGLVLSGLGMGTLGGVLLQRFFTVSRGRSALIDASGVIGAVLGLATENVVEQAFDSQATRTPERTANYALGGVAAGLLLGGILTRSLDEPKLPVSPTFLKTRGPNGTSTTSIGFTTTF